MKSINPATGAFIRRYEEISSEDLEDKLEQVSITFRDWRETSFAKRSDLMACAARVLRDRAKEYAAIITAEMGKPITQSIAEVEKCALVCDYYAKNAEQFLARREVESDGKQSYVRYDPIGPVLAIMPWNFPFWQVFRFAAPALMAGNVGVLKHASNVPACALAIEEVFREAGFPDGVFYTLLASSDRVRSIIRDSRITAVTLTGSGPAGSQVTSIAGSALKKTVLELGGSDPFIVLGDADIERAAEVAALSRTINTGQSCIAAKRFIVVRDVAEAFADALLKNLASLTVGDPMEERTDVGPMAREDLREELHDQVLRSVKQGARALLGGKIPEGPGFFYPITLLTDVTAHMPVATEETFGPVAPVLVVDGVDEAIALANASEFGLGASVWSRDLKSAHDLARRIESGAVFVNGLVKSDPRLPFGGVKQSGFGRELSSEGIREFVNVKSVWMDP
ncbi:MAG: NAD-dependent succinate-semialdehyde dehydrogenase [Deltaproteobacteria bacterium]|nr:NAD-dependent succinate-semialdehyde dehydrogenase [Deltaproteobacteria bacterium]